MNKMLCLGLFLIVLFGCSQLPNPTSIEGTFVGGWAETIWMLEFYKDNTFKITSEGHFGNSTVQGKYRIHSDTIEILSGFEDSDGTVNRSYLIDGDSCIIDIDLRYDYCREDKIQKQFTEMNGEKLELLHASRKRNIKYPQIPAIDVNQISQLENAINAVLNLDTLQAPLSCLGDTILMTRYFEVNGENMSIKIGDKLIIFNNLDKMNERKFVEIEDINLNQSHASFWMKIWCNGNWRSVMTDFSIENQKWEIEYFQLIPTR